MEVDIIIFVQFKCQTMHFLPFELSVCLVNIETCHDRLHPTLAPEILQRDINNLEWVLDSKIEEYFICSQIELIVSCQSWNLASLTLLVKK